ncbi:ribonuclease H-like domain-containing protein [Tanacetum coccineum]
MTDYSLWEVIKNGNKVLKRTVGTVKQEYEPTTAEEKQDMRNEMKARATLLMALPNKDQLKFHSYQDAKLLMEAIEKRYGGNKQSKKVQRTLLKQQYENFATLSSETMDQTFDRLQKLVSQLEIQGEVINQKDMNLKLLRSLPSEWKTYALIWRNKVEIETINLDDLYNNLKIYEQELIRSASTSQNPQNVAFVSNITNSTNNTNKADNTAYEVSTAHTQGNGVNSTSLDNLCDVVICAFLASQPNSPKLAQEDLEQLYPDDLEEIDLQWEMAMLTIRARRFINMQEAGHKWSKMETPTQNALIAQDRIGGYDWSYQAEEEQPTNHALMAFTSSGSSSSSDSESQFNLVSYKAGLESVEARLAHYKKNEAVFEESINVLKLKVRLRDNALDEYKIKLEKAEKERDQLKQTLEKFQNSSKSLIDLLESQVIDKFKIATAASPAVESFVNLSDKSGSDKGYHSVPLPLTGNFIPRKPDLTFIDEIVESENLDVTTVVTPCNDKTVENKGVSNTIESNAVRMNNTSALIIEDWNSDDESKVEPNDKTVRPRTEKIKLYKTVRLYSLAPPKQNKHHPRGNQRNWNNLMSQRLGSDFKMINKACYVCGSFEHLHYVCDKKVVRPMWNNSRRANHKNFTNKMTHPYPKRSFVPQAVLTRSGKLSTAGATVKTVRPVNTANTKAVNTVRPVNSAASKPIVNHPRPKTNAFKRGYSQSSRPFNRHFANKNSTINTNFNTARVKRTTARDRAVVSKNKGKEANVVKASACWGNPQQKEYKEKAVIDSGCSRHMAGNKCYLDEYEDYDGGFVSFGDGKGRIYGKGKIKTGSLDFDDVYFCKELKYNLFSVTQICDKKNNVLFTDTECLVLSSDFKLLDESQVLLRVPRKDNIYSVDLKSVVLTGGLTCLIAKATIDESNTWHRRLRRINFKTMNKLVKGNLVKVLARISARMVVVSRKNRTLIEAARTMLVDSKLPTTFWAEAVNMLAIAKLGLTMRVFNKRTRIVEETLNIILLENTPNVKENGPDWLFDIDSLTISINYVPIVAGYQTNGIAGTKDNIVAGQAQKEKEPEQDTPVSTAGPSFDIVVPSTPVNTAGPSVSTANAFEEHLFERFSHFKNAFTLPPVLNVSSMDNTVPDTSFTKFHKDHPEDQVIGSLKTPVQTRHMTKIDEEHAGWEAMKDEAFYIYTAKVKTLVDLPRDKWAIGTKWVFRNKKDERGIVVKNKARLVYQGHTQEEGIDYDEIFAPVARIDVTSENFRNFE